MLSQRSVTTTLFVLLITAGLAFALIRLLTYGPEPGLVVPFVAAAINGGLLALHLRGWVYASRLLLLIVSLSVVAGAPEVYITQKFSPSMFIPPIIALVVATPRWVVATALVIYAGMIARGGWGGVMTEPGNVLIYGLGIVGLVLAGTVRAREGQTA